MAEVAGVCRQLIICCDGTNNTLTGRMHDTNVLKVVDRLRPDQNHQLLYYDPGVGAPDQLPSADTWDRIKRKWERIRGLASGRGIYENIGLGYQFLVENYESGDEIYIFGFSRGAFTARCVAGVVNLFGLVRRENVVLIPTLVSVYFSKRTQRKNVSGKKRTRGDVAAQIRSVFTNSVGAAVPIHFVGVWDTVASVGLPFVSDAQITSDGFSENKEHLRHIRHALSLDEHRATFRPRLYWDTQDYDLPKKDKSLKQRWFRGVHGDVGGGYVNAEAMLSNQALAWMLSEARACGLRLDPPLVLPSQPEGHRSSKLIAHDECYVNPFWGVAGLVIRKFEHQPGAGNDEVSIPEGAAADPNQRVESSWFGPIPWAPTILAVAAALFLIVLCGFLSAAAFSGTFDLSRFSLSAALDGGRAFDAWQRESAWRAIFVNKNCEFPFFAGIRFAVWATIADFILILAYSWFLGLFASKAFARIAGFLRVREKMRPILIFGWAPCIAVSADIIENFLTLLTISFLSYDHLFLSLVAASFMAVANGVKWIGLISSGVFILAGLILPSRLKH